MNKFNFACFISLLFAWLIVAHANPDRLTPDRYIPARHSAAEHAIAQQSLLGQLAEGEAAAGRSAYQSVLAQELLSNGDERAILSNRRARKFVTLSPLSKQICRAAHIKADKVLDAPDMQDNFYYDLLDWSSNNILAVALEKSIIFYDTETENISKIEASNFVSAVRWSPNGRYLATATEDGAFTVFDWKRLRTVYTLVPQHGHRIAALSWNGDKIISLGSFDGFIKHLNISSRAEQWPEHRGSEHEITGLAWSPDGKVLAVGSNDNSLSLWELSANHLHRTFRIQHHEGAVKALAWSPHQSNVLASGGGKNDGKISVWNSRTGELKREIETGAQVSGLLWGPESDIIVSSHGDMLTGQRNEIVVWRGSRRICTGAGHTQRVLGIKMGPDGTVVSIGSDETVRFWKVFKDRKSFKRDVDRGASMLIEQEPLWPVIR